MDSEDPRVATLAKRIHRVAETCTAYCGTVLDEAEQCDLRSLCQEVIGQIGELGFDTTAYRVAGPDQINLALPFGPIHRAVFNLVKNASEAMAGHSAPPALTLGLRVSGDQVFIDVADTGPGFGKGPAHGQSLGLGLHTTYEHIAKLGGDLVLVQSDAHGTRFRIVLPARLCDAGDPS